MLNKLKPTLCLLVSKSCSAAALPMDGLQKMHKSTVFNESMTRESPALSAGLGAKLRENAFILNDNQEKPSEGTQRVTMNAYDLHDQSVGYTPPALDMNSSPRHYRILPVLPPLLAHDSK